MNSIKWVSVVVFQLSWAIYASPFHYSDGPKKTPGGGDQGGKEKVSEAVRRFRSEPSGDKSNTELLFEVTSEVLKHHPGDEDTLKIKVWRTSGPTEISLTQERLVKLRGYAKLLVDYKNSASGCNDPSTAKFRDFIDDFAGVLLQAVVGKENEKKEVEREIAQNTLVDYARVGRHYLDLKREVSNSKPMKDKGEQDLDNFLADWGLEDAFTGIVTDVFLQRLPTRDRDSTSINNPDMKKRFKTGYDAIEALPKNYAQVCMVKLPGEAQYNLKRATGISENLGATELINTARGFVIVKELQKEFEESKRQGKPVESKVASKVREGVAKNYILQKMVESGQPMLMTKMEALIDRLLAGNGEVEPQDRTDLEVFRKQFEH